MHRAGTLLIVLALPLLAGCVAQQAGIRFDGTCIETAGAETGPGGFQYGGLACSKDGVETYDWENPAPVASIQWGGTVGAGALVLRILDGSGREVYAASLDAAGAEGAQGSTDPGVPSIPGVPGFGPWTIELTFTEFTGTMGLEVRSG